MKSIRLFALNHPFAFGVMSATIQTGGTDLAVQHYAEKREQINYHRLAVFTSLGFAFSGCWQYVLYTKIMPRLCPGAEAFATKSIGEKLKDRQGLKELGVQVGIENGINNPILYFPVFYTLQEFVENGFEGKVSNALEKYWQNAAEDIKAIWSVWIPVQFINFGFSPMWFRTPFVAIANLFWTSYISLSRGCVGDGPNGGLHKGPHGGVHDAIEDRYRP